MRRSILLATIAGLGGLAVPPAVAAPLTSITLDGSLGHGSGAVLPTSPGFYTIPPAMGKSIGPNLFQSFGVFNLGTGDTADFEANAGTQNIIARVTGGTASTIDGTIESAANLWFINPAGIMFTANASLGVNGAFVASTASYARLNDGAIFYADASHLINDAGLSSAPVSAFGFLTATPQPIIFTGTQLTNAGGIHAIGGNLTLDAATLLAPGGNLTLFSAASTGEVPFSLGSPTAGFAAATNTVFGNITLRNGASIVAAGTGGGGVVIRGGKLICDNARISSVTSGTATGGSLAVQVATLTLQDDSTIFSTTFGQGRAGDVNLKVENLSLQQGSSIYSSTEAGTGDAGYVQILASRNISLTGKSVIDDGSDSLGNGGGVLIKTQNLFVGGDSSISSSTFSVGNSRGVVIEAANVLKLSSGSKINCGTYGQGTANAPVINAGFLLIGGPSNTGIFGDSTGSGNISSIDIHATSQFTMNGGSVSTAAFGAGNAGSIQIQSPLIALNAASIDASANSGQAGEIVLHAARILSLTDHTKIDTSASEVGGGVFLDSGVATYLLDSELSTVAHEGGNIFVNSPRTVLNRSFIFADADGGLGGNFFQGGGILMLNDSRIEATGSITITSPQIDLSGSLAPLAGIIVDEENRLRESCARSVNHESSSLIAVGRGGTPSDPEELQSDFGVER